MLTVSFLREFFLKSCHQQSSQSSLSAYASVLQGDTLSKQSNLLIPPVFISRKNPARTKPRQTARNSKHCPCWGKYGHRLMNQKKNTSNTVRTLKNKCVFQASPGSAANPAATGVPTWGGMCWSWLLVWPFLPVLQSHMVSRTSCSSTAWKLQG